MNSLRIVDALLGGEDDDIPIEHYTQRVTVGTAEQVLTKLGFKQEYGDWKMRVPLKHNRFHFSFGEPVANRPRPRVGYHSAVPITAVVDPNTLESNYIEIRVDAERDYEDPRYPGQQIAGRPTDYARVVHFSPENLSISSSRLALGSESGLRGPLPARLNAVIRDLFDAIAKADAEKHDDLYEMFSAIDRHWGKQPNRFVKKYTRRRRVVKREQQNPAP